MVTPPKGTCLSPQRRLVFQKTAVTISRTFDFSTFGIMLLTICLTLSWRRPISYRNQSIDLLRKSMVWFLYDIGIRHERVKAFFNHFSVDWVDWVSFVVCLSRLYPLKLFKGCLPQYLLSPFLKTLSQLSLRLVFIYFFSHIRLRTEIYKQTLFEQPWIYLLYWPNIFTNKLAKRVHMKRELFFWKQKFQIIWSNR